MQICLLVLIQICIIKELVSPDGDMQSDVGVCNSVYEIAFFLSVIHNKYC